MVPRIRRRGHGSRPWLTLADARVVNRHAGVIVFMGK
jgi:hypothetical protein